ncbi:Fe-S-containing hydro-lyase [Natronospora cellulosivora (SeqCode)]
MDLNIPLTDKEIFNLKAGDRITLSGVIYTARDAAHARILELIKNGDKLPIPLKGQVIYYVGPAPSKPGHVIGSAGPTTSYRMDPYVPSLLERGLKAMIGKGPRSQEVKDAMRAHKAVYLAAVGGAAALISQCIKKSEVIAYPELGAEAIRRLEVESFPAIVINDIYGNDMYQDGVERYRNYND